MCSAIFLSKILLHITKNNKAGVIMKAFAVKHRITIIIIAREFIITGVRLIAVEDGVVIAANLWGKIKTVTQMVAIILLLIDRNIFFAFVNNNLVGAQLIINILSSVMISIATIATVFSLIVYLKDSKDVILKNK